MRRGRIGALITLAVTLLGCGTSGVTRGPDLRRLPLADGARVIAQVRECDPGASAYCALQLVVVGPQYSTSAELVSGEHAQLRRHGWTGASGDTSDEHAADSPGHKLRVTYATAFDDLNRLDLPKSTIKRAQAIRLALSRALFDRASAISVMLELGPG